MLEDNYELIVGICAIGLPLLALIVFFGYYKMRQGFKPKVVKINPIYLVGYQIETTDETFEQDDELLWEKYKDRRATIPNRKETFSNLSIKKKLDGNRWRYGIGTIVNDYSEVPSDLVKLEVPAGLYVYVRFNANDLSTWKKKREKIENYMFEKWIPESEYELDYDTDAFEMEYHDKRDAANTRIIILYFAVKKKSSVPAE